jgi:hypothetical protein
MITVMKGFHLMILKQRIRVVARIVCYLEITIVPFLHLKVMHYPFVIIFVVWFCECFIQCLLFRTRRMFVAWFCEFFIQHLLFRIRKMFVTWFCACFIQYFIPDNKYYSGLKEEVLDEAFTGPGSKHSSGSKMKPEDIMSLFEDDYVYEVIPIDDSKTNNQ